MIFFFLIFFLTEHEVVGFPGWVECRANGLEEQVQQTRQQTHRERREEWTDTWQLWKRCWERSEEERVKDGGELTDWRMGEK